jgi:hypothetical protein
MPVLRRAVGAQADLHRCGREAALLLLLRRLLLPL